MLFRSEIERIRAAYDAVAAEAARMGPVGDLFVNELSGLMQHIANDTLTPAVIDALRVVRLPYHLSAITQAVARAALRHTDALQAQVQELRTERDATVTWLRDHGFTVADTDANFVLFGLFDDRHAIWQGLLDRGVLIRETGPQGYLRVSIGTAEEMAAFRGALKEVTGA